MLCYLINASKKKNRKSLAFHRPHTRAALKNLLTILDTNSAVFACARTSILNISRTTPLIKKPFLLASLTNGDKMLVLNRVSHPGI